MSDLLTYLSNTDSQFRKPRLAALYSDFLPLRTLNPDGYIANISAWRLGLASAVRAGATPARDSTSDLLSLTVDQVLLRALETKEWGRPLALGTVIREAQEKGQWIEVEQFKRSNESIYAGKGWRLPPLGDVVWWGLRQVGLVGTKDENFQTGSFTVKVTILENIEDAGRAVEKRIKDVDQGRVHRIYSHSSFKREFEDVLGTEKKLSESDMGLLLKYLQRDMGLLNYDGEIVKIRAPGEKIANTISAEDKTIAHIKTLIEDLESQTKILAGRIDKLGAAAKDAVGRKNRVAALAALKSKKLAETTLKNRYATLNQLEEVFAKIEQAADQIELVHVMEGSSKVLAGLNKEVGGVDRVDEVVDQLREQIGQVDEVGTVVAELGQEAGNVDEAELDSELEAMEQEDNAKGKARDLAEKEKKEELLAAETKQKLSALEEVEKQAIEAAIRRSDEQPTAVEELSKSTGAMKLN